MKRQKYPGNWRKAATTLLPGWLALLALMVVAAPAHSEPFRRIPLQAAISGPAAKPVTLQSFLGRPVLLNFWAPWCVPCRVEMPELQSLQKKLGSKVVVIGVTAENNPRKIAAFIKRLKVTLPIYIDPEARLHRAAKVLVMPTTILLDAKGKMVRVYRGFNREHGLSGMEKDLRRLEERP